MARSAVLTGNINTRALLPAPGQVGLRAVRPAGHLRSAHLRRSAPMARTTPRAFGIGNRIQETMLHSSFPPRKPIRTYALLAILRLVALATIFD